MTYGITWSFTGPDSTVMTCHTCGVTQETVGLDEWRAFLVAHAPSAHPLTLSE